MSIKDAQIESIRLLGDEFAAVAEKPSTRHVKEPRTIREEILGRHEPIEACSRGEVEETRKGA